jgi:hypothetical protein
LVAFHESSFIKWKKHVSHGFDLKLEKVDGQQFKS